ncbi:ATP-binding protein [Streptomyces sp. ActVer]|uniref:ATP-binding protein n=1 Tax=Streptomyces sp. ActVer TaxID=3014558 RepID=UPI0022B35747|nr:ATP-binding protein [Streptomyces sp. ActVer]MCZ4507854.1 ATP-binding protein [Streptomyces sp. ActVer]
MSDQSCPRPIGHRRGQRRRARGAEPLRTEKGLHLRLRLLVLVPALFVAAILCMAAAVGTTARVHVDGWIIGAVAAAAGLAVLVSADWMAVRTAAELHRQRSEYSDSVHGWLRHFQSSVDDGRKSISDALEQIDRGERPFPPDFSAAQANSDGNPWNEAEAALFQLQAETWRAVVNGRQTELTQALVYLAGGLTLLLVRALGIVTELTNQVQDPDLLYRVYDVNNLLKRMRRSAGRLAVLGGVKARTLNQPIGLVALLRGASGEIEKYARVRMHTSTLDVQIPGFAGPDLIHLLAELEENATLCSPPDSKVVVRATRVTAGLAVEIEDRGIGMAQGELDRCNRMLADPQDTDLAEQLAQRQTGLLVVAKLARRYGIQVRLQKNLMHGITALVVVPDKLLLWQNEPAAPSQAHAYVAATPVPAAQLTRLPGPRQSGGPRPSPPAPVPAGTAPLPYRDARPAPGRRPVASTATTAAPPLGATSDTRPRLPQRTPQATVHERAAPAEPEAAPVPLAPPDPAFVSNFTQGVHRAEQAAADSEARPPKGSAS